MAHLCTDQCTSNGQEWEPGQWPAASQLSSFCRILSDTSNRMFCLLIPLPPTKSELLSKSWVTSCMKSAVPCCPDILYVIIARQPFLGESWYHHSHISIKFIVFWHHPCAPVFLLLGNMLSIVKSQLSVDQVLMVTVFSAFVYGLIFCSGRDGRA